MQTTAETAPNELQALATSHVASLTHSRCNNHNKNSFKTSNKSKEESSDSKDYTVELVNKTNNNRIQAQVMQNSPKNQKKYTQKSK